MSDAELRTHQTNQLNQISQKFSREQAKRALSYKFYIYQFSLSDMKKATFLAETIFRCSIRPKQPGHRRIERVGRSKLIQINSTEPDIELFMRLTHQVWFVS